MILHRPCVRGRAAVLVALAIHPVALLVVTVESVVPDRRTRDGGDGFLVDLHPVLLLLGAVDEAIVDRYRGGRVPVTTLHLDALLARAVGVDVAVADRDVVAVVDLETADRYQPRHRQRLEHQSGTHMLDVHDLPATAARW